MRFRFAALALALGLSACASGSGERAAGFITVQVQSAYIPVEGRTYLLVDDHAAAFVFAPGIAVTNAHNGDFLKAPVIATSRNYDVLFFRTDRVALPTFGTPSVGERVIAYGQGLRGELRQAIGVVRTLDSPVEARCSGCVLQSAFTYDADAGPGFSGGPVVDAVSGAIIGITFGYVGDKAHRVMYAYSMSRLRNEFATLQGRAAEPER
ncbi:MAG TPA: serine protease [Rhizomicrobium sp.]|jgi:S1-C subfamily serine protease|nr:serine protease [Rhizomicrobium sp.]